MNFFKDILDFILPPHCAICKKPLKREESIVCKECMNSIEFITHPYDLSPLRIRPLATGDKMLQLIHLFKYRAKISIGKRLGEMMMPTLMDDAVLKQTDVIIPLPLYKTRQRQRGFNQSEILAVAMLKNERDIPIYKNVLIRAINTKSQTELSREQREKNVKNAFKVRTREPIKKKKITLVDDVFTTGATLTACAKVLLKAGAESVSAITAYHKSD